MILDWLIDRWLKRHEDRIREILREGAKAGVADAVRAELAELDHRRAAAGDGMGPDCEHQLARGARGSCYPCWRVWREKRKTAEIPSDAGAGPSTAACWSCSHGHADHCISGGTGAGTDYSGKCSRCLCPAFVDAAALARCAGCKRSMPGAGPLTHGGVHWCGKCPPPPDPDELPIAPYLGDDDSVPDAVRNAPPPPEPGQNTESGRPLPEPAPPNPAAHMGVDYHRKS